MPGPHWRFSRWSRLWCVGRDVHWKQSSLEQSWQRCVLLLPWWDRTVRKQRKEQWRKHALVVRYNQKYRYAVKKDKDSQCLCVVQWASVCTDLNWLHSYLVVVVVTSMLELCKLVKRHLSDHFSYINHLVWKLFASCTNYHYFKTQENSISVMILSQSCQENADKVPGNFRSSCLREDWHSKHMEGCWTGPFHKQLELRYAGRPLWSASSAKTPVKLPPRLLEGTEIKEASSQCGISTLSEVPLVPDCALQHPL